MGQRRIDLNHPQPEAVAETVRQDKTSFAGAAAFLAGEGAFAFAADRDGLAGVLDRVWLRPSAARRLAGFLDLRPPGVIGYWVTDDPGAPAQLGGRTSPLETLVAVMRALQGDTIDSERQLQIASCCEHDGPWSVEATITYQHHFKLSGGQWSIDQPTIRLRAKGDGHGVLLAAVVSRAEDIAQVRRVAERIERRSDGLILEEIALPEDAAERHKELRRLLAALGDADCMRVGSFHTRERERKAAEPPADEWAAHNEAASYRMRPHTVEAMLQRIEDVDDSSFASAVAYLPDSSGLVVAVTLRQNAGRDDHLGIFFHGARHREEPAAALTKDVWDAGRPVDWDEREKSRRVLELWATAAEALLRSGMAQQRDGSSGGGAHEAAA
jgi:hypothetical protein